jgi:hypothetical protein
VSLSFSSISEYALSELPFTRPESNLEIELFTDVSVVKNLPTDTVALALNYANDVIYPVYYGGNKNPWIAPLAVTITDSAQQVFKFVDTAILTLESTATTSSILNSVEVSTLEVNLSSTTTTRYEIPDGTISLEVEIDSYEQPSWLISDPTVLSVDGEYFHNLRLYSNENAVLSIEVVEQKFAEDAPSENWRDRPGLPISPISFNAISVEQSSGPIAKTFPDFSTLELEISADDVTSSSVSTVDTSTLVFADNDQFAISINVVDTGNLTTVSISDQVVFLNSEETARLDIAATDQIQQVFEFIEIAEIAVFAAETMSAALGVVDSANNNIAVNQTMASRLNYYDTTPIDITGTGLESKLSSYVTDLILVTEPNDQISLRYYDFSNASLNVDLKTFAKEYTFLQQISSIDTVRASIRIESTESFGITARPKQVWFG